jgi:hypothetical protein
MVFSRCVSRTTGAGAHFCGPLWWAASNLFVSLAPQHFPTLAVFMQLQASSWDSTSTMSDNEAKLEKLNWCQPVLPFLRLRCGHQRICADV